MMARHAGAAREGAGILVATTFCAIFLNGFEAGGYQACLQSVGTEYSLTGSLMGALASVQLVAALIAPLAFGPIADRRGKRPMLLAFLAVEAASGVLAAISRDPVLFAVAIFGVGMAVSTVQYVALAGLADAFPATGRRKLGFVTGMYSLGAVTSPLLCGTLISAGMSWRTFFVVLAVASAAVCGAALACDFSPKEEAGAAIGADTGEAAGEDAWDGLGVGLLCLVMFVYVGVESGIGYFMNSFVGTELSGSGSYLALSLFWAAMIPSRMLCGAQAARRGPLLVAACVGAGVLTASMALLSSSAAAVALAAAMGFFCGAVYPCVLAYVVDFAAGRTATATGLVTAATGLGGAIVTLAFGWMSDALGMRMAFAFLGGLMLVDVAVAVALLARARRPHA
ncbi:MAG: MFS transporter [Atopobiaceae bacterium]|jgi:MFS family permease|nr:MFS transporter [Atopobiaceae bacterium]